jgi:hypothetical protein
MGQVSIQSLSPYAHETLTVGTGALPLTATVYTVAGIKDAAALISTEAALRYWLDGTSPTSTVGHVLPAGDVLALSGLGAIKGFRFILQSTGTTGPLSISYLRR